MKTTLAQSVKVIACCSVGQLPYQCGVAPFAHTMAAARRVGLFPQLTNQPTYLSDTQDPRGCSLRTREQLVCSRFFSQLPRQLKTLNQLAKVCRPRLAGLSLLRDFCHYASFVHGLLSIVHFPSLHRFTASLTISLSKENILHSSAAACLSRFHPHRIPAACSITSDCTLHSAPTTHRLDPPPPHCLVYHRLLPLRAPPRFHISK